MEQTIVTMTKTVAYIHSYPGAAQTLRMLWSGFKKLGLPIIGVDCDGEPTSWPEPVETIVAGRNAYFTEDYCNLPSRLVLTMKHFLTTDYQRAVVMEYDTLITAPLPDWPLHPYRMIATYAGGKLPNSDASCFFHTPWVCDRSTAGVIVGVGTQIMTEGLCSQYPHGSPDVFLGLIMDRVNARWEDIGPVTFSRNTIHSPEDIAAARVAREKGATFFHGVKHREVMEAILA